MANWFAELAYFMTKSNFNWNNTNKCQMQMARREREPKSLMCIDRDIEGPGLSATDQNQMAVRNGGNQLKGTNSHKATRTTRITTAFGRRRCKFAVFGD